jgi:hypothetical protein
MKIMIWDNTLKQDIEIGEERRFYIVLDNGDRFDISVNGNHQDEFMISGDLSLRIRPRATNTMYVSGE